MTTDPNAQPLIDPTTKYEVDIPMQSQPVPGLASELEPP
ncbi:NAD(P)-dependent dehydrogenase, partial [Dietzia sp. SLG510A3-3B2-2]|nr:NAD(P)-dependent dehydrogenase [Dietzia sp. SLG510A3-30A2]MBB1010204.1 NAD(P)-dependent dehydrogenase [Dietzia sp. SLG510A3-3B2-2]